MTHIILFPDKATQSLCTEAQFAYYITHYQHVKNYLSAIGEVTMIDADTTIQSTRHNNNFLVEIDGKKAVFDYSDFDYNTVNFSELSNDISYFKFHTTAASNSACLPFPPMSFMDWNMYESIEKEVKYDPNGVIFYKCKIYGGAIERREKVKAILEEYSGLPVDFELVEQEEYFKSFSHCRINVIVPGARNDMVDRSHLQSFALGIPVITPRLTTLMPFGKMFEANVDYIECAPDYSDVIDLIERYKDDKEHLDFISRNCKNKFAETCTRQNVCKWILANLHSGSVRFS